RQSIYKLEGRNDRRSDREEADAEERFSFNTIDTIPYWYEPLSRVFAFPFPGVTHRATTWVCDRWGRSDQDIYEDARRRRNEHQWYLMSNRHGSVPTLENLRSYIEYHALYCVAGELIDEPLPILVGD